MVDSLSKALAHGLPSFSSCLTGISLSPTSQAPAGLLPPSPYRTEHPRPQLSSPTSPLSTRTPWVLTPTPVLNCICALTHSTRRLPAVSSLLNWSSRHTNFNRLSHSTSISEMNVINSCFQAQ